MAITYDVATNTIRVTGYTEGTPCNFTDIYNADKAGTLSLHARAGITGADGAPVAVDRAERPTDFIVLGGASNDLYITVANWNGTNATIRITGRDRDGAAQAEDIVINANGAFYTTKWFKTITHTQVTAFTATGFDYDLIQGQWGTVSKLFGDMFEIDTTRITISSGYFADENKYINFSGDYSFIGAWQGIITTTGTGQLRLGNYIDETRKTSHNGCHFITSCGEEVSWTYSFINEAGDNIKIYSSTFTIIGGSPYSPSSRNATGYLKSGSRIWNCMLNNCQLYRSYAGVDHYNINIVNAYWGLYYCAGNFDKISVAESIYLMKCRVAIAEPIKNLFGRGTNGFEIYQNTAETYYLVNPDSDSWNFWWKYNTGGTYVYRQYTFNLKVLDTNQNNIENATVALKDKDGTQIFSLTTNASGEITEQTVTYGYYNQANGNTLQSSSPHTLEIRKAGYQTYKKKFTLDKKTDWIIGLKHSNVCVDQEVMLS